MHETGLARRQDRGGGGVAALVFGVYVLACLVFPKQLSSIPRSDHTGIAPDVLSISTFGLAVWFTTAAAAMLLLLQQRQRFFPFWQAAFALYLGVAVTVAWAATPMQLAGTVQLLGGAGAWVVGWWAGLRIFADERAVRHLAVLLLGVVSLEAVVSVAQLSGVPINPLPEKSAVLMGDRTNGTLSHPNNLGKAVFIVLGLALGLMGTANRVTQRILGATVVVAFIPLALCQGRATLFAAVAAVVLWLLLSRETSRLFVKLAVIVAVALIVAPFVSTFTGRFSEDPDGGPRASLSQSAMEQIAKAPVWGVGPNSYVSAVSAYDTVVAQGYPVHNSYLLTTAEIGVVGATLFWIPVFLLVFRAVRHVRSPGFPGSVATAIVASVPGYYVITTTGWGLLDSSMLPFWFLVLGVMSAPLRASLAERSRAVGLVRRG